VTSLTQTGSQVDRLYDVVSALAEWGVASILCFLERSPTPSRS